MNRTSLHFLFDRSASFPVPRRGTYVRRVLRGDRMTAIWRGYAWIKSVEKTGEGHVVEVDLSPNQLLAVSYFEN